jgi:hypothetical protein
MVKRTKAVGTNSSTKQRIDPARSQRIVGLKDILESLYCEVRRKEAIGN